MNRVVCYSGGYSSALVALNVAEKYGTENLYLVNHDISPFVEDEDIKRFKREVANFLEVPITYANYKGLPVDELPDQFEVCVSISAFKVGSGSELCTAKLKTEPFMEWLEKNVPDKNCIIYYGFDFDEKDRIQRRTGILGAQGYKTEYPLATWKYREFYDTGRIERPLTYSKFKHANCKGCLKAGKLHWYIVFCEYPEIWAKGKWAEEEIGFSILKEGFLEEFEERFSRMKAAGIEGNEHDGGQSFWAKVRRWEKDQEINIPLPFDETDARPCECVV